MEIIAQFVKGATETGSRVNVSETMHGVIALLDSSMVLLQAIIEVFVRSMEHLMLSDNHSCRRIASWKNRFTVTFGDEDFGSILNILPIHDIL